MPAATPPAVIVRLSAEMQKHQQKREFREFLVKIGMEPWAPIASSQFSALVKEELPRSSEAVRVARKSLEGISFRFDAGSAQGIGLSS